MQTYKVERAAKELLVVRIEVDSTTELDQWVLLRSDAHHDSMKCDRELEEKHLKLAMERNALILDFGDSHDVMQSPADKRQSKSDLRPEHKGADYFNLVTESMARDYGKYSKNWILFGEGNHESAVKNKMGIDLLANLCTLLRYEYDSPAQAGTYAGYVRFHFTCKGHRMGSKLLKWHHGSGGGGPVTGGMIQGQRMAVFVADADFVVQGHYHESWHRVFMKEAVVQDRVIYRPQYHLCIPGYKNEYVGSGWSVERGHPPKPRGAIWLRFSCKSSVLQEEITLAT